MKQSDNRKKLNNKGISLIEVIVVVLIIGITSTVVTVSVSYAYSTSASRAADEVMSYLDLVRTKSMSMVEDSLVLRVKRTSSGECLIQTIKKVNAGLEEIIDSEKLCSDSIEITFVSPTNLQILTAGNQFDISFKKNTGGMVENYNEIIFNRGRVAKIRLVKDTGRCYLE